MNETLVFIPLHVFNNFDQVFLTDNGLAVPLIGVLYALSSLASYYLLHKFELFQKEGILNLPF